MRTKAKLTGCQPRYNSGIVVMFRNATTGMNTVEPVPARRRARMRR